MTLLRRLLIPCAAILACVALSAVSIAQTGQVGQPPPPPEAAPSQQAPAQIPGQDPAPSANAREARFAFIVGNDGYDGANLPTAAQDAGLIADTLKAAGFDVMGARNLDLDTFRASFREYLQKVAGAGEGAVALVYLSGYGMQLEGENYFVPVGVKIERDTDLSLNAVRLSDLTRPLGGMQGKVKIAVFDLAYKIPFAIAGEVAPGLTMMQPERDMLVAMNATPGTFAPESRPPYGSYAQALAEMMREGGLQMRDIFDRTRLRVSDLSKGTQIPWEESTVSEPFTFFERKSGQPAPGASEAQLETQREKPLQELSPEEAYAAALARDTFAGYQEFLKLYPDSPFAKNVRGILAARREALFWQRTIADGSPQGFWTYLRRYPRGPHAADARRRLRRLAAAAEPPADFEIISYDVPPPPLEELSYFEGPSPVYFEEVVMPVVSFYAPPAPGWWIPPPPPLIDPDDPYFLPLSATYIIPDDIYVSDYVVPPPYYAPPPGYAYLPYVAIPSVVAAGILAGRFVHRRGVFRPRVMPAVARAPRVMRLNRTNLQRPAGFRAPAARHNLAPVNRQQQLQRQQQQRQLQQRSQTPQQRSLTPQQQGRQQQLQQRQQLQQQRQQQQIQQRQQLQQQRQLQQQQRQQNLQNRRQQQQQQRQLQQQQRQQNLQNRRQQQQLQRQQPQRQLQQRQQLQRQQLQRQQQQQRQFQPRQQQFRAPQRQIQAPRQQQFRAPQRQIQAPRQQQFRAPQRQFQAPRQQQFRAPVRSAPVRSAPSRTFRR